MACVVAVVGQPVLSPESVCRTHKQTPPQPKAMRSSFLLFLLRLLLCAAAADAGPLTMAVCLPACYTACLTVGVVAFAAACASAPATAAGAAVVAAGGLTMPGPGVFVSCSSICGPVCANGIWMPTP